MGGYINAESYYSMASPGKIKTGIQWMVLILESVLHETALGYDFFKWSWYLS